MPTVDSESPPVARCGAASRGQPWQKALAQLGADLQQPKQINSALRSCDFPSALLLLRHLGKAAIPLGAGSYNAVAWLEIYSRCAASHGMAAALNVVGRLLPLRFKTRRLCAAPLWWQNGRRRMVHRSYAEVELLSRMAELLMPGQPIGELFRDFPVEPSKKWGSRWLCPDITAMGVLKDENAALFIEYDGYYLHSDDQGALRDKRKTEALLHYAAPGSCILRICHVSRGLSRLGNTSHATINRWRACHEPSLMRAVRQTTGALLTGFGNRLRNDVREHLHATEIDGAKPDFHMACKFAGEAVFTRDVGAKKAAMLSFLEADLKLSDTSIRALGSKFPNIWGCSAVNTLKPTAAWLEDVGLSREQVASIIGRFPAVLGYSIEAKLKPTVAWLEEIGLSRQQVAKTIARFPAVLGCNIDANLRPTVAWLEEVGLSREQVAKSVARFPSVLQYSIEANMKPTVVWLEEIGLTREQVAKAIARFPAVLGCSIAANLRPTVAWLEEVGLSREQVAKVVARFPAVLGCSIEANLKPTVAWLEEVGLSRGQMAKVIAWFPAVLTYSIDANLRPTVAWLAEVGLSREQVAKVVARSPSVLGYSIEANLKPTVAVLEDVGLSREQVAKVVARFAPVLGYSIEANLKPTVAWLEEIGLSRQQVAKAIARFPAVLGCSMEANLKPTVAWLEEVGLSLEQSAKVVAFFPQIFGCDLEANLKPTVAWLEEVGLSREQLAKAVARFPTVLALSIEANLKPMLAWLEGIGLCRNQVCKIFECFPQLFGLSIEYNLTQKLILLRLFYHKDQISSMITRRPQLFGYSYDRLHQRLEALHMRGDLVKLTSVMDLTEERFARRFLLRPIGKRCVATAARSRCWREALALASELVERGLRPNVATVASTLNAVRGAPSSVAICEGVLQDMQRRPACHNDVLDDPRFGAIVMTNSVKCADQLGAQGQRCMLIPCMNAFVKEVLPQCADTARCQDTCVSYGCTAYAAYCGKIVLQSGPGYLATDPALLEGDAASLAPAGPAASPEEVLRSLVQEQSASSPLALSQVFLASLALLGISVAAFALHRRPTLAEPLLAQIEANDVVYSSAIFVAADAADWASALGLFARAEDEQLAVDAVMLSSALFACSESQAWQAAMRLLHNAQETSLELNTVAANAAIGALAAGDAWEEALLLFHSVTPDDITPSAQVSGYSA
eukprot:s940_g5.t1